MLGESLCIIIDCIHFNPQLYFRICDGTTVANNGGVCLERAAALYI